MNLNHEILAAEPLNIAINARVEQLSLLKHAGDPPRGYLGASLAGETCLRKVQFSWMTSETFSARIRSIFARGHFHEAESRQQLIEAGFQFASPERLGFIIEGGMIAGHADGIITAAPAGVPLAVPACWEAKCLNSKNFRAVEREGLAKPFPRYAAQVALYQQFLFVKNPALMTITNADTCERLHFLVPFDPLLAKEAFDRAVTVVEATRAGVLLPRLDPAMESFTCRYCGFRERCARYE